MAEAGVIGKPDPVAGNVVKAFNERLLPAALLLKAAALAAREVPQPNGFWTDDHFEPGDGVHLGVAVSPRGGGLLTPALHDADTLPLPALMAALKDVAVRPRTVDGLLGVHPARSISSISSSSRRPLRNSVAAAWTRTTTPA